jgi:hypothetical protein
MAMGMQASINREWGESYARGMVAAPRSWAYDGRLARFRYAGEALAELDSPDPSGEAAEEVARALAEAAAGGDVLAARVVLQHVLPDLSALAWGWWLRGVRNDERRDVYDSMVSTVWLSLVSGDALRGEVGIRTRLFRDAEYWVLQRPRRRRKTENRAVMAARRDAVADLSGRPESAGTPAGEELLAVVCEAVRNGLALRDAQVLTDLGTGSNARYGVGAVTEAAKVDPGGVTTRCIRYRRAAALRRVRALTGEAA